MEHLSVGKLISAVFRQIKIIIEHKLEKYPLNPGQINFFMEIGQNPGMTQEELSHYLLIDKATTAKAIRILMQNGLVSRERDRSDKRAYRLFLSTEGDKYFPEVRGLLKEITDILSEGFNQNEFEQSIHFLERMLENMDKYRKH